VLHALAALMAPSPFDHPQLADALLHHLCCFLNAPDALLGLAAVSRRFHRAVASPLAKRVLRLRLSRDSQAPAILGEGGLLRRGELDKLEELDLAISDRAKLIELPISGAHVDALAEHAPRIRTLQLACVRMHHTVLAKLGCLEHLTSLSLDFTPASSAGLTASSATLDLNYYAALLELKHLRRLRFVCSWKGRSAFLSKLAGLTLLESLELRFKSAELTAETTAAWAAGMPRLQQLILHKMTPTAGAEQPTDVFDPLVSLTSLTRLELPHSISAFSMFDKLRNLRSLALLVAENPARGTDSEVAPLEALTQLTHLNLTNHEAAADPLLQQLQLHAPRSLTSLQLSLDVSLTRAGCQALERIRSVRFLTLLNAELVLDASDSECARFLQRLEYLHVNHLALVQPLQHAELISAPALPETPTRTERANPLQFLARHAQRLEVLRMDDPWSVSLLPLAHCAALRVLGDAQATLFGFGNRGGTRSNVLRHPSLDDPLREWLSSHRYPTWDDRWHRSSTLVYAYALGSNTLPAFMPGAKEEFFKRLAVAEARADPAAFERSNEQIRMPPERRGRVI